MALIRLKNAKFKQFAKPINLEIQDTQKWAIMGPNRTQLLDILAGKHIPEDPKSRNYIWGKEFWPTKVIKRVEFGQGPQSQAPYIAARFESFRDEFDYTLRETLEQKAPAKAVDLVIKQLHLEAIADRWECALSNGQSRRVQIAHALIQNPKILIVEDPFLGVDPENTRRIDSVLRNLPIPLILGLCNSENMPGWVNKIAIAGEKEVISGDRNDLEPRFQPISPTKRRKTDLGEPILELQDLSITIKSQPIFDKLSLKLHQSERLHLKGPNGSGKSTLIAVITADHPQSWTEQVVMFGEPRQVGKHSYPGINRRIGFTSPEIHAIFPKNLTAFDSIATGFRGDMTRRKDLTSEETNHVNHWIERIGVDGKTKFGDLNKTQQKLVLLARALVKRPDLLLLDEAFSTFDEQSLKLGFEILDEYSGAVIVIAHNAAEIPPCDNVLDMSDYCTVEGR